MMRSDVINQRSIYMSSLTIRVNSFSFVFIRVKKKRTEISFCPPFKNRVSGLFLSPDNRPNFLRRQTCGILILLQSQFLFS